MFRLSKLTDYSIVLLTAMSEEVGRVYSATELAAKTHLEQTTVAKILKRLSKSGLIRSYRGANGGYRLVEEPADITVSSVIGAMEGPIGMTECSVSPGACAQEAYCKVQSNWQIISRAVENALGNVTLADMATQMAPTADVRRLKVVTIT
ncbi:MAG: SUF system Fe-S cluster assembly regulator [Pseudomonadota bacterium]